MLDMASGKVTPIEYQPRQALPGESALERMTLALHVLTTKFEKPSDVAHTAEASKTLHELLAPEVDKRGMEVRFDALLVAWTDKVNLARAGVEARLKQGWSCGALQNLINIGQYEVVQDALTAWLPQNASNLMLFGLQAKLFLGTGEADKAIALAKSSFCWPDDYCRTIVIRAEIQNGAMGRAREQLDKCGFVDAVDRALFTAAIEGVPACSTLPLPPTATQALQTACTRIDGFPHHAGRASELVALYAVLGDTPNTLLWMEKAVAAEYDHQLATVLNSPGVRRALGPEWRPLQERASELARTPIQLPPRPMNPPR